VFWVRIVGVANQSSRGNGPDINRIVSKGVEDKSLLAGNRYGYPVILARRRIGCGAAGIRRRIFSSFPIADPVTSLANIGLFPRGQIASRDRIRVTAPDWLIRVRWIAGTQGHGDESQRE